MTIYALELENVVGVIGETPIINDVSLSVARNSLLSIVGDNGAGKSTLFHMISGLVPIMSGEVRIDGQLANAKPVHARSGMGLAVAMQSPALIGDCTAEEHLAFACAPNVFDGRAGFLGCSTRDELMRETLARTGLWGVRRQAAKSLSHAQRKWLEVGIAISQAPSLLLLDEPVAGLADGQIGKMITLVRDLLDSLAIVLIEHRDHFLRGLGGQVCVLESGRVLKQGTYSECQSELAALRHDKEL